MATSCEVNEHGQHKELLSTCKKSQPRHGSGQGVDIHMDRSWCQGRKTVTRTTSLMVNTQCRRDVDKTTTRLPHEHHSLAHMNAKCIAIMYKTAPSDVWQHDDNVHRACMIKQCMQTPSDVAHGLEAYSPFPPDDGGYMRVGSQGTYSDRFPHDNAWHRTIIGAYLLYLLPLVTWKVRLFQSKRCWLVRDITVVRCRRDAFMANKVGQKFVMLSRSMVM